MGMHPFSKVDHRPFALTGNGQGFFVSAVSFGVERDHDAEAAPSSSKARSKRA